MTQPGDGKADPESIAVPFSIINATLDIADSLGQPDFSEGLAIELQFVYAVGFLTGIAQESRGRR